MDLMVNERERSLISISEASLFVGVSEAALRLWTDEGRIKAFITPGGHRRYLVEELKKFMASRQKSLGIKQLVNGLEETAATHREMDRSRFQAISWYSKLSQEDQIKLAGAGRRILDLVIRYVSEPSRREEVASLAQETGAFFGDTLAKAGLPLTDAVEAFILHREPLIKAATRLVRRRESISGRVVDAIPLVGHIMDETLVSLVAAHQKYQAKPSGEGL